MEDEKPAKWVSPGQTRINLIMDYTPLLPVNTDLEGEPERPMSVNEGKPLTLSLEGHHDLPMFTVLVTSGYE